MKGPLESLLVALGLILACSAGLQAQERAPQTAPPGRESPAPSGEETRPAFPGEAELVTVDVVLTDKEGNRVTGLTVDDFTVEEEGVPQVVSSFEAVELPPAPSHEPLPRPPVSTNMLPRQRASRTFVIVFDDLHLTPRDAPQAKGAVAAFLKNGVREGDYASLLATSGDSWWNTRMEAGREDLLAILRRLEGRRLPEERLDRLSDWEAMRIAEYNDTMVGQQVLRRFQTLRLMPDNAFPSDRVQGVRDNREEESNFYTRGINDLVVESRASETYHNVRTRSNRTLSALRRALLSLASAKGRKSLILVSDGFVLDTSLEGFKQVVQTARRSNVAIYFVNTRGLQGLESLYGADLVAPVVSRDLGAVLADVTQEAAGSEHLANDTGGFVIRNTNDLEDGIERIARESLSYYLLGYDPSHTPHDGSYRRIEVKVRGKELNIRARKGYYAPGGAATPAEGAKVDADIQRVLDSPYLTDEIPMRMTAYVREEALFGQARTLLAAEIDVTDLGFQEREDGRRAGTLHLLLAIAHRGSSEVQREDKEVEIVLRPGSPAQSSAAWYAFNREFQLAKGWYQAKLVARDAHDRKLGTVTHEFEVPDLEGWRVSTPVLSDRLQQQGADSVPTPLLVAHRQFASGSPLFCQFDVYGATKGMVTGIPQVSAGYALVRADGTTVFQAEPTAIRPTSLGYLSRLWAMGLAGVEPGGYELLITVRDEISGREQVLREPLTVTAAPAEPSTGG